MLMLKNVGIGKIFIQILFFLKASYAFKSKFIPVM